MDERAVLRTVVRRVVPLLGLLHLVNYVDRVNIGFAAPYITGWLADLTGTQRAGTWVVGVCMLAGAVTVVVPRSAPPPNGAMASSADDDVSSG